MENKIFDDNRIYQPEDPEITSTLGDKNAQAQKRHRKTSPAYFCLGRKIFYHGKDCNEWADAQRIETIVAGCSDGEVS